MIPGQSATPVQSVTPDSDRQAASPPTAKTDAAEPESGLQEQKFDLGSLDDWYPSDNVVQEYETVATIDSPEQLQILPDTAAGEKQSSGGVTPADQRDTSGPAESDRVQKQEPQVQQEQQTQHTIQTAPEPNSTTSTQVQRTPTSSGETIRSQPFQPIGRPNSLSQKSEPAKTAPRVSSPSKQTQSSKYHGFDRVNMHGLSNPNAISLDRLENGSAPIERPAFQAVINKQDTKAAPISQIRHMPFGRSATAPINRPLAKNTSEQSPRGVQPQVRVSAPRVVQGSSPSPGPSRSPAAVLNDAATVLKSANSGTGTNLSRETLPTKANGDHDQRKSQDTLSPPSPPESSESPSPQPSEQQAEKSWWSRMLG